MGAMHLVKFLLLFLFFFVPVVLVNTENNVFKTADSLSPSLS